MMGGVGGHAGLFSNAHDLAQLMQLFLRKGEIGGCEYILPEVVDQYTSYQYYPSNRRGAGFDKPVVNGNGGPCSNLASKSSFGHSGFTGTLVWVDPEYDLIYVFLSNRVYPDSENWKIIKMNIRTEIQDIIYKAIQKSN
jgi:CubicO group peptidase (beta-lactamase class C family)